MDCFASLAMTKEEEEEEEEEELEPFPDRREHERLWTYFRPRAVGGAAQEWRRMNRVGR
jgi:hypothetical protein